MSAIIFCINILSFLKHTMKIKNFFVKSACNNPSLAFVYHKSERPNVLCEKTESEQHRLVVIATYSPASVHVIIRVLNLNKCSSDSGS